MKTCVIYARYSSSNQTEQSIEGQLDVCSKYAKENNLHIVNTYIDRAMTGTNDNRPDFQKMLSDSERENWEVVLVYAIDRFGRDSVEIAINKHRLKKNGKMLISATQRTSENLDGTINLDGILLENIYIGMAEYYSVECFYGHFLYDAPIYRLSSSRCSTVKSASQRQKIVTKNL